MRNLPSHISKLVFVGSALWLFGVARVIAADAALEKTLAGLRAYHYGGDRAPLTEIESRVKLPPSAETRRDLEAGLAAILGTDAAYEAKDFACRQLWIIGTKESVPAIAPLLADDKTVGIACYALEGNPSTEAGQALRAALGKTESVVVRQSLVQAIGNRRDKAAVSEISALASNREPSMAAAALTALGRIGDTKAVDAARAARKRSEPVVRAAASDALLKLAAVSKAAEAETLYRELDQADEPAQVRAAALHGLTRHAPAQATPVLIEALEQGDAARQRAAASCLLVLPANQDFTPFIRVLPKLPASAKVAVISVLAERGGAAALAAIQPQLEYADAEVRAAAASAVGALGGASSVAPLSSLLGSGRTAGERQAAQAALRALRPSEIDQVIVSAIPSCSPDVQAELVSVLAARGAANATPELLKLAGGEQPVLRRAVFKALKSLASDSDLPVIVATLAQMRGDAAREEAEQTAVEIASKVPDESKRTEIVRGALASASAEGRGSLLRVLGGLGTPSALAALSALKDDAEATTRDIAVREIARWPDVAAMPVLGQIEQSTTNAAHRALAFQGLVRLLPQLPDRARVVDGFRTALQKAQSAEDRKLILSGLGAVPDPEALRLAASLLIDATVRAEVELACLQIGGALAGTSPKIVREILGDLAKSSKSEGRRKKAQELLQQMDALAAYLTAWQVAGPFAEAGKDFSALFDQVFPPEQAGAAVNWRPMPAGTDPQRPWLLDLLKLYGGEQRVAYLRTSVKSDSAQPALLEIGADDGVKVWCNGAVVHANNVARPLQPGSDKVTLALRAGWNTILLKVTQNNQGWECCARLVKPDGAPITGIEIDPAAK